MWLKTAAHRLAKWVPTSAEFRRQMLEATAAAQQVAERVMPHEALPVGREEPGDSADAADSTDPNVVDAEVVDTTTGEVGSGAAW